MTASVHQNEHLLVIVLTWRLTVMIGAASPNTSVPTMAVR
jgi:hypothetical protein